MARSLDGFIARPDGGLDWLEHDSGGEDYGYHAFIASVDVLVMGRRSFEVVSSFPEWPYGSLPVVVCSRTLGAGDLPAGLTDRVTVAAGPPAEILAGLAGAKHVYVDGGQLAQAFLRAGLVDRLTVTTIPILIGAGVPFFGPLDGDLRLTHVETQAWSSGVVQSTYAPVAVGRVPPLEP